MTLRDEMLKHSWQEAMVGPDLVRVDDAIDAFRQWLADEGLVVVPREATSPMVEQGYYQSFSRWMPNESVQDSYDIARAQWQAMIAAAPDALRAEGE